MGCSNPNLPNKCWLVVDLTGAKVFLSNDDMRSRFLNHLQSACSDQWASYNGRPLLYYACVRLLLGALHILHKHWRSKNLLTAEEIVEYRSAIEKFRHAWVGLQWKPTVWVHWACAHSSFFVVTYKTIYAFSSIPTEHRHQKFKQDLRNTCQAWKFRDPLRCKGYLKRCLEMDALDQGLRKRRRSDCPSGAIFQPRVTNQ